MSGPVEQGDLSAAQLFREHAAFVARFLFRLGVPADAIQDTVQEVFLVVHQRGGYRKGPAKPTSYLAVIATHAAAAQRRKARALSAQRDGAEPDDLTGHGANPELTLETRDSLRRLQLALDKLDPDLRATLLLADGEEETCSSIAEAMGVPVGTVYWRLHEARKKFQRAVAAVDASLNRPRALARDRGEASNPVLVRSAKMLSVVFGWLLPSWRGSEAHALLRETAKQMPIEYDVQAELARHAESVTRMPVASAISFSLPPPSTSTVFGSSALKTGLLVTTGGAVVVTALHLLAGQEQPAIATNVANTAPAMVREDTVTAQRSDQVPPGTPVVAPLVVTEPAHDDASASARSVPSGSQGNSNRRSVRVSSPELTHGVSRSSDDGPRSSEARQAAIPERPAREAEREVPGQPAEPPADPYAMDEVVEAQALGRAQNLLGRDPAQALGIARKVAAHGRSDYLVEERRYIEVMALCALERDGEAERSANEFLSSYPQSVFASRVKDARKGTCAGR